MSLILDRAYSILSLQAQYLRQKEMFICVNGVSNGAQFALLDRMHRVQHVSENNPDNNTSSNMMISLFIEFEPHS